MITFLSITSILCLCTVVLELREIKRKKLGENIFNILGDMLLSIFGDFHSGTWRLIGSFLLLIFCILTIINRFGK
jgi:hypothetical protein